MNDQAPINERAVIGGNNPPDPITETLAPFTDAIEEAANWADGLEVNDEASMKAVDSLISDIRKAKTALGKAEKEATAPLSAAHKAEVARWKPAKEDVERRLKSLVALVGTYKGKLAAEKEAARREAYKEAQRKENEAKAAIAEANAGMLSDQEAIDKAKEEAKAAQAALAAANKDTVKGLRKVTKYEITDHRDALHWIARHDNEAMTAFIEEYVRRNHKAKQIAGVHVYQIKEAF